MGLRILLAWNTEAVPHLCIRTKNSTPMLSLILLEKILRHVLVYTMEMTSSASCAVEIISRQSGL